MFIIRPYLESDLDDVIALWELCDLTRPWNNPEIDIFRKLAQRDQLFLLAVKDDQLIATVMGGYDGHRGWVNYLAVHPHFQRNGVATALIQQLEKRLIALGCPKLQLLIRQDNIDVQNFYEQLGYEEVEVICLGKRLITD
ncbi:MULTISPECIES: GNAT family acetyltransferase [Acinetobacter]|jgi:Acetyltransferases|uniref:GNAT family acetyltransferase n=1 Tax=Acinetobacter amyesii TaxID=2942470 RepID=A0A1T1H489_9GAMM|nr:MULTISPECIES: GNAT family acetyltransferase [Acinetobacter]MCL6237623.1 GNAT family acetyltransferase [Acinetobacter amyesii]MCL6241208.1 GNAT family acetyltransferase [Acinetobacter amyesii]MCL6244451.1 GNAT family acetyltransferase [Acinetobacter amyesii]MCL6247362.1 GNAT family acetyltransferase [Acinetobacter amyesii]OOV83313.1 GNAT family acetyltransferase [Acinetobacter sp. ANC 5600]